MRVLQYYKMFWKRAVITYLYKATDRPMVCCLVSLIKQWIFLMLLVLAAEAAQEDMPRRYILILVGEMNST